MKTENNGDAVLIKISDLSIRAYLRRYPFVNGPDMDMNNKSLDVIRKSIRIRRNNSPAEIISDDVVSTEIEPEENKRAISLFKNLGVDEVQYKNLLNDYGWRVNKISRDATDVLSIGCGNGYELIFIKALLPDAHITAIDDRDKIDRRLYSILNFKFIEGDFNVVSEKIKNKYDLIFSNHFLEHTCDPDSLIKNIFHLLRPRGILIAGLPLDSSVDTVFSEEILKLSNNPDRLHPIDLNYFDPGHPWKTNAADLTATLRNNKFHAITIYQRAQHPSRYIFGSEKTYNNKFKRARCLNKIFFSPMHSLIKLIFPRSPPYIARKILFAVESRCWFGSNWLKANFSPDVVVVAERE